MDESPTTQGEGKYYGEKRMIRISHAGGDDCTSRMKKSAQCRGLMRMIPYSDGWYLFRVIDLICVRGVSRLHKLEFGVTDSSAVTSDRPLLDHPGSRGSGAILH